MLRFVTGQTSFEVEGYHHNHPKETSLPSLTIRLLAGPVTLLSFAEAAHAGPYGTLDGDDEGFEDNKITVSYARTF